MAERKRKSPSRKSHGFLWRVMHYLVRAFFRLFIAMERFAIRGCGDPDCPDCGDDDEAPASNHKASNGFTPMALAMIMMAPEDCGDPDCPFHGDGDQDEDQDESEPPQPTLH